MTPQSRDEANAILMTNVTVPVFWSKMASELGHVAKSKEESERFLRLNDMIKMAVDGYLNEVENGKAVVAEQAVKYALDSTFEVLGGNEKQQPQSPEFLLDAQVKAAAAFLFNEKVKASMDTGVIPAKPFEGKETPEEEEAEKEKAKMAGEAK